MSFEVPENQSVSWAVYWPSVIREADVTVEEAQVWMDKTMLAFDMGEPIWMAAATLKQYVELNRFVTKTKTPLQLAKRVVRC